MTRLLIAFRFLPIADLFIYSDNAGFSGNCCSKRQQDLGPRLYTEFDGDYRIIYAIKDEVLIILILDVGHRKEIYQFNEDSHK